MTMVFGQPEGLQFEIDWLGDEDDAPAAMTEAAVVVRVDSMVVWGRDVVDDQAEPAKLLMIDLLEFLSSRWEWLRLEEGYPIPLSPAPDRPSMFRQEAQRRWEELGLADMDAEEEALFAFEDRHDLSNAFPGIRLDPLWALRRGNEMVLDAEASGLVICSAREVISTLTELGDTVADRLHQSSADYATEVVQRWNDRSRDPSNGSEIN